MPIADQSQPAISDECIPGTLNVNQHTAESLPHPAYFDVGPRLSDEAREAAIVRAGLAMEKHMQEVRDINNRDPHIFSDFADAAAARWKAHWARESMEKLIAGRSKAA